MTIGPFGIDRAPGDSEGMRYLDVRGLTYELAPWFPERVDDLLKALIPLARQVISKSADYRAVPHIFNQSANDVLSLLADVAAGNGRSAMRCSRSLIEHAINMADVVADEDMGERYIQHLDMVYVLLERVSIGSELLKGRDRQKYQRQLKHAANKVRLRMERARRSYGSRFERSWTPKTLFDRAAEHGLDHLYDYYRLASLFMHGAAGGSLGTAQQVQEKTVHRTGPALELCPFALLTGLRGFREMVHRVSIRRNDVVIAPVISAIDSLIDRWPDYRRLIVDVDNEIWPKSPPPEPQAVLAFARSGRRRWYWHDPQLGIMIEADPPRLSSEVERVIQEMIDRALEAPNEHIDSDERWAAIGMESLITVSPHPDGRVIPDSALRLSGHATGSTGR